MSPAVNRLHLMLKKGAAFYLQVKRRGEDSNLQTREGSGSLANKYYEQIRDRCTTWLCDHG